MEGRDLESICKAVLRRIDECLKEATEVVKSIQLSQIGSHEPVKCQPTFKPVNLYGSNWLQRIENSRDRFCLTIILKTGLRPKSIDLSCRHFWFDASKNEATSRYAGPAQLQIECECDGHGHFVGVDVVEYS